MKIEGKTKVPPTGLLPMNDILSHQLWGFLSLLSVFGNKFYFLLGQFSATTTTLHK